MAKKPKPKVPKCPRCGCVDLKPYPHGRAMVTCARPGCVWVGPRPGTPRYVEARGYGAGKGALRSH